MIFEKVKLEEICSSISDGDHQAPPKVNKGVPFVTISNITNTNQLDFSNTMFVPQEYYDKLDSKRKAQEGDILYSVVGSFGIPVYIKETTPFVFQRHIAILRPNVDKIVPEFLYYTMLNRDFYMKADAVAIGAAQRTISLTALRNMDIDIPDIEKQKKIAKILTAYDVLIENNQKQIKLLEEVAERLYKEWFVDLHFPRYKDVKVIDGVPEEWNKELIGNVIGKVSRTKQIKTADYLSEGSIPIIDQSRDFIAGYTNDSEALVNTGTPVIVFGDHTRILKYIQFPFAKGADGTQLIISDRTNMPQSLLYLSLIAVDLSNYHYARHFKYLKAESILIPSQDVADEFDRLISPIFSQIQKLREKCYKLSQARDRLLPKLMSGEIEV
ncbi:restriction endonuclease subunit S [Holdemanella biformis]|uniref:Restriction endonuclease subunit S n=1 Tax=Holdemanella biformis TaxID=1735 RepID=A0A395WDS3_9FIRM|nr:restriction endonuclease subunit S [Holdemanella biformis]RGU73273.1 restriction endonuclease subunit S [Holdemanella biformis]RGU93279.1 restriction endonuclease subunit S [Holdemanella biformis]